jgi:hypothetical protein
VAASVRLRHRLATKRLAADPWKQGTGAAAVATGTGRRRARPLHARTVRLLVTTDAALRGLNWICGSPLCSRDHPVDMVGTAARLTTVATVGTGVHQVTVATVAIAVRQVTALRVEDRVVPAMVVDHVLPATAADRTAHPVPVAGVTGAEAVAVTHREVEGAMPAAAAGIRPVVVTNLTDRSA